MNLLDLNQDARERFILKLPDVADIIALEQTNHELREWIQKSGIYHRWEKKHLGKTDKWRILLSQELGVKGKRYMYFKHVKFNMSINFSIEGGRCKITLVCRGSQRPFDDIRQKIRHYYHLDVHLNHNAQGIQQYFVTYEDTHATSIANYYFLYDLLAYGFEYGSEVDMRGNYESERLIRCRLGQPISHKCNLCDAQFCSNSDCPDWIEHQERGCSNVQRN